MSQVCHFCMEGNFLKYQQSDFEKILKNKGAIVYPAANGPTVFLNAKFFDSQDEFAFWKSISDEDYRIRETAERRERTHTVPISDLPEELTAVQSAESALIARLDVSLDQEQLRTILSKLRSILTERQLRRYWLCVVCGHSRKELAAQEGVSSTAVVKSIRQAKSRIEASGIF